MHRNICEVAGWCAWIDAGFQGFVVRRIPGSNPRPFLVIIKYSRGIPSYSWMLWVATGGIPLLILMLGDHFNSYLKVSLSGFHKFPGRFQEAKTHLGTAATVEVPQYVVLFMNVGSDASPLPGSVEEIDLSTSSEEWSLSVHCYLAWMGVGILS